MFDLRQHAGHDLLGVSVVLSSRGPGVPQWGEQAGSLAQEIHQGATDKVLFTFMNVIPLRSNIVFPLWEKIQSEHNYSLEYFVFFL